MSGDYVCDCEPDVHPDGSKTHERACAAYPQCPHELGSYACLMPCGCPCAACVSLGEAQ